MTASTSPSPRLSSTLIWNGFQTVYSALPYLVFAIEITTDFPSSLGVFFLFGAGRLALCRSQPKRAIAYYTQAMETQSQYRNLHHISFWEIAIANLALWDLRSSWECWRDLEREATVNFVLLYSWCRLFSWLIIRFNSCSGRRVFTRTAWRYASSKLGRGMRRSRKLPRS